MREITLLVVQSLPIRIAMRPLHSLGAGYQDATSSMILVGAPCPEKLLMMIDPLRCRPEFLTLRTLP
jgi:hypothetical protein